MTIRNPIEWATDQFKLAGWAIGSASRAGSGLNETWRLHSRRFTASGSTTSRRL